MAPKGKRASTTQFWSGVALGLAIGLAALAFVLFTPKEVTQVAQRELPENRLFDSVLVVEKIFADLHDGSGGDSIPRGRNQGPVYVVLRQDGLALASHWEETGAWEQSLKRGLDAAAAKIRRQNARISAVEVVLTHRYRSIPRFTGGRLSNIHRGILGLEVSHKNKTVRYSPTDMIARNLSFNNAVNYIIRDLRIDETQLNREAKGRTFEGYQYLVTLDDESANAVRMLRGNRVVPPEAVTKEKVETLAQSLGDWLKAQVNPDGRMTYRYFPSRGTESNANNLIRQFMGTICLGREATIRQDPLMVDLVERNLNYNFATFFGEDGDLGFVEKNNQVKLGAVALAALAIVEHPRREKFSQVENGLQNMVNHLWQADGSFNTFYRPANRVRDNKNFYPGEALLLWAINYDKEPNQQLLERFMASFRYYRTWHRKNRNPAFVPWHTQAYYIIWQHTKDPELVQFIFEMNDWLLDMQQWDGVRYADTKGRFFNPKKPAYGPPHASSTGVYLEGLIDAFALARELGDHKRQEAYRVAIARGLRSVMQLQFNDEVDMFYISQRDKVIGGLRTRVYDNPVRIDNVQHNLMGIQKIMKEFKPEDYRL